jgi:hypothetical protein
MVGVQFVLPGLHVDHHVFPIMLRLKNGTKLLVIDRRPPRGRMRIVRIHTLHTRIIARASTRGKRSRRFSDYRKDSRLPTSSALLVVEQRVVALVR